MFFWVALKVCASSTVLFEVWGKYWGNCRILRRKKSGKVNLVPILINKKLDDIHTCKLGKLTLNQDKSCKMH